MDGTDRAAAVVELSGALPSWPCLGPGRVIVSWMPCDCPSATQCASGAGHLRVSCQTPGAVLVKHGNVADAQTDGQVMQYRELPLRPYLLKRFQLGRQASLIGHRTGWVTLRQRDDLLALKAEHPPGQGKQRKDSALLAVRQHLGRFSLHRRLPRP